jgi:mitofusin
MAEEAASHIVSPHKRGHVRRALSFADDPTAETEVVFTPAKRMQRSMTLATVADVPEPETQEQSGEDECLIPTTHADDFHLLRLDLKLGAHGSSSSAAALVSQLEKSSIANLLDERLGNASGHMAKLRLRIEDTSSKVLVTGDLNSGKSTFVNALLRRHVMPVDQQPCTTAFCEVHDASENGGKEEVHVVHDGSTYQISDVSTFEPAPVSALDDIISKLEEDEPSTTPKKIKVYLQDNSSPEESLINNGIVDISLIDAPGLNRDNEKTTANFSKQEEIDVIVFVVSAENHFTLSGKEFLYTAAMEKAYVFVVVNKYEGIRDKNKCRRLVLDQIKALSPRTFENADELVHFVDSANSSHSPAFTGLQAALRTFILEKRGKSKLAPVAHYLSHLTADIELLAGANAIVAQEEHDRAKADLERAKPVLDQMLASKDHVDDGIEHIEEEGANEARTRTKQVLEDGLTRLGDGQPAVPIGMPTYPGLLAVWEYARDVRRILIESLDAAVKHAEDEARATTTAGVQKVHELEEAHLPPTAERNRRIFMPEAMFRPLNSNSKKSRRTSVAGISGVGLSLSQRTDLIETTFFDIFDAQHTLWDQFASETDGKSVDGEESSSVTAIGALSVGLGALTMVGGQAMGARGLLEIVVRLTDLMGNERARKWAPPVLAAALLGAMGYVVVDLPQSIPRNVGRRIRRELVAPVHVGESSIMGAVGMSLPLATSAAVATIAEPAFADAHAERIARETRKVLRLAGFDLKERFKAAQEDADKQVRKAEDEMRTAKGAEEHFVKVVDRAGQIRKEAGFASAKLGF